MFEAEGFGCDGQSGLTANGKASIQWRSRVARGKCTGRTARGCGHGRDQGWASEVFGEGAEAWRATTRDGYRWVVDESGFGLAGTQRRHVVDVSQFRGQGKSIPYKGWYQMVSLIFLNRFSDFMNEVLLQKNPNVERDHDWWPWWLTHYRTIIVIIVTTAKLLGASAR